MNSFAGPKGGGQDARNKVMQGTAFRRLETYAGEQCGLIGGSLKLVPLGLLTEIYGHEINKAAHLR